MPYNFATDSFHTKKLSSRLSSSEVRFFTEISRFAYFRPPWGDLGETYDDHLRLIGERVVDFLLALIELFSLRRYGRLSVENRRFCSNGDRLTQNFRQKGSPLTNHSSSQKTRLNYLSCSIKIWIDLFSVLSQYTRVTDGRTDGRTDGQTEFSSLYRVCITCSAVKIIPTISVFFVCKWHILEHFYAQCLDLFARYFCTNAPPPFPNPSLFPWLHLC